MSRCSLRNFKRRAIVKRIVKREWDGRRLTDVSMKRKRGSMQDEYGLASLSVGQTIVKLARLVLAH